MQATIELDEMLFEKAQELTGIKEKSLLMNLALEALIARECGVRLALLGGSEPKLTVAKRGRT